MLATSNHAATVFALPSKAFTALYRLHIRGRDLSLPQLELPPKSFALRLVAPLPRDSKHASGAGAGAGARERARERARARVAAGAATVGRCTYGEGNSLWLMQELERLLSVQKRPGHGLVLTRGRWSWVLQDEDHYQLVGKMEFHNITEKFEIFVPEVEGKLQLLAGISLNLISTSIQIFPQHPQGNPAPRKDGYWPAYIIPAGESTSIEVSVDIFSREGISLTELQATRLDIEYISYGPHGRSTHVQHVVLPLQYLDTSSSNIQWRKWYYY